MVGLETRQTSTGATVYAGRADGYRSAGFSEDLRSSRARVAWGGTLIVLTSDHGEAFWEHRDLEGSGICGHGHSLFRELIDIPLIIRYPGGSRVGRVERRVESIDIAPTLFEAANIEHRERFTARQRGRSLLAPPVPSEAQYAFSELISDDKSPLRLESVQDNVVKLVRTYQWKEQLFDPPLEQFYAVYAGDKMILADERAEPTRHTSLRRALEEWRAGAQGFESGQISVNASEDRALRERLQALGYIEVGLDDGPEEGGTDPR